MRNMGAVMGYSPDNLGRQRFLVLSLRDHFYGYIPDWLKDSTVNPLKSVRIDYIYIFLKDFIV